MLKILSFVCNEHICLLSDEADLRVRVCLPTSRFGIGDLGLVIWDFGLRIVQKKVWWLVANWEATDR